MKNTTQQVLESLAKEPKSTRSLILEIEELGDRKEASLFMNGLARENLILKQGNGYWRLREAGKVKLNAVEQDKMDKATDYVNGLKAHQMSQSDTVEVAIPKVEPGTICKMNKPIPPILQETSKPWSSVESLKESIPEGASLVIESDGVFMCFAGRKFNVNQDGDIEALFRTASLYSGEVA